MMQTGDLVSEKYEILELLGKGGMGAVFKARQRQLSRTVALKILHQDYLGDDRSLKRFQQEATAAGNLSHPNLATIFDCGELPTGSPYIVMEYIEGIPLSEMIKSTGTLPKETVCLIGRQIAEALGYAHSQGVIHRDLKPGNILIVTMNGKPFVKIVDFGIAKVINSENGEAQALTKTGEVFGSPLYMSPEQCGGYKLDGRSDIYALGCVLYEMLTGVVPLKGQNSVQTICKHLQEHAKPLCETRPDLAFDPEIEKVVSKCLAKAAEDRFQTMQEVASALDRIAASDPDANGAEPAKTKPAKFVLPPKQDRITISASALTGSFTAPQKATVAGLSRISLIAACLGLTLVFVIVFAGLLTFTGLIHIDKPSHNIVIHPDHPEGQVFTNAPVLFNNAFDVAEGKPTRKGHPQVQMVAVYQGIGNPQTVTVRVTQKTPCELVLFSYDPVIWKVKFDRGALVQRVILAGYEEQSVVGVPNEIPVVPCSYRKKDGTVWSKRPFEIPIAINLMQNNTKEFRNSTEYADLKKMVLEATGHQLTRLQAHKIWGEFDV